MSTPPSKKTPDGVRTPGPVRMPAKVHARPVLVSTSYFPALLISPSSPSLVLLSRLLNLTGWLAHSNSAFSSICGSSTSRDDDVR